LVAFIFSCVVAVEQYYRERGEYKEGIVEIFDALAAYALDRSLKSIGEIERKKEVLDYIQKADAINQRNEYTWLIKGFFELAFGSPLFYLLKFDDSRKHR
jgi:hypothetical protein